eukprot:TRINITY_DN56829_c0_g1_i1.p1 TRINITY_DN56829_c0_g1~~TRINITY_DN56829_c0_g1_i1.p1  ORF type:complete len:488 (-),score=71.17 TRINITY_DN56829_c0_g1_i1:55-1518(-)
MASEDMYFFSYADGMREGAYITERLEFDQVHGRFTWTRSHDQDKLGFEKSTVSTCMTSRVSSVRFSTRLGDPSREYLNTAETQIWRRRDLLGWFTSKAPALLAVLSMVFNVLSLSLFLAGMVVLSCWRILPRTNGDLDMSSGPHSEALAATAGFAFLSSGSALMAGWWLGCWFPAGWVCGTTGMLVCGGIGWALERFGASWTGRLAAGSLGWVLAWLVASRFHSVKRNESNGNLLSRLEEKVAAKCAFQRPVSGSILSLLVVWCLFILVFSPVSYGLSHKTECTSGGCQKRPGLLPPVCGVGDCSCGVLADLRCGSAEQNGDSSFCKNVKQPLCTAKGTSQDHGASGIHAALANMIIGISILTSLVFVVWVMNASIMLRAWIFAKSEDTRPKVMVPQVQYHRFAVSFVGPAERKMIFTLSAEDDPLAVAAALMPRGTRARGLSHAYYDAPLNLGGGFVTGFDGGSSTGIPAVFDDEGENGELEPQWC